MRRFHPPLRLQLLGLIHPKLCIIKPNTHNLQGVQCRSSSIAAQAVHELHHPPLPTLVTPVQTPKPAIEEILTHQFTERICKYTAYRMFLAHKEKSSLSLESLHLLLQIAADHIPSKRNLSVFVNDPIDEYSTSEWRSFVKRWVSVANKNKPKFASLESQLLKENSRLLLNLDLAIAGLVECTIVSMLNEKLTVGDLFALLSLHSRRGNFNAALSYFLALESAGAVSREAYWMMIQAGALPTGSMGVALKWYHRLLCDGRIQELPGIRIFRTLMKGFLMRDLDMAIWCLMEYERMHLRPANLDMYILLMIRLEKSGRGEDVRAVFERMLAWGEDAIVPNVRAWNMYILSFKDGCYGAGPIDLMGLVSRGVEPDVGTFYALMEVLASQNDIIQAGKQCIEALNRGFMLSTRMWHILFLSLLKSDDIGAFDKHFQEIEGSSVAQLNSDQYFHSLYLKRLVTKGQVQSAIAHAKSQTACGVYPRRFTYEILMKSLIHQGHSGYAIKLFEQMQQSDVVGALGTYHSLLAARIRNLDFYEDPEVGLSNLIQDIFTEMKAQSILPTTDTYNTILASLLLVQTKDLAFRFLEKFDFQPNIITYTILLKLVSPTMLESDFKRITSAVMIPTPSDTATSTDNLTPPNSFDSIFFTVLFTALTSKTHQNSTQFSHFVNLFFSLISHTHLKPDVICFNSLMAGYWRLNQAEQALATYKYMVEKVEGNMVPTVQTFTILILILSVLPPKPANTRLPIRLANGCIETVECNLRGVYEGILRCGWEPDVRVFRALAKTLVDGNKAWYSASSAGISGDFDQRKATAAWLLDEMKQRGIRGEDHTLFVNLRKLASSI
ncbi:hypothetical protein BDR26DRAFT_861624 [Obelidium mucronatum]|nr:hypothetical protein BDR26DRAFT_861624 [Obelidium mucronatum]